MKIKSTWILVAFVYVAASQALAANTASRRPAADLSLDDLTCKNKIINVVFQAGPDSMCGPGHMTASDVIGPSVVEAGYSWNANYKCEGDTGRYLVITDLNCNLVKKIALTGK